MSLTLNFRTAITAAETLEGAPDSAAASKRVVTHDQFDTALTLNAASTPAVSRCSNAKIALAAGAATIDLTAMQGIGAAAASVVNATGLKLQLMKFKNLGANPMTIVPGAANGYQWGNSATDQITVAPKVGTIPGEVTVFCNGAAPTVAGGAKTIDIAGTLVQEFEIQLYFG